MNHHLRLLLAAGLALLSLSLVATSATAQTSGLNSAAAWEQFHPDAAQHTSSLNLNRPAVLEHLQVSTGVFAHFVDDPLVVLDRNGTGVRSKVVDDQIKTEIGASIGLFDIAQVNVVVPVIPYQTGNGRRAVGGTRDATGTYVSDFRVSVDAPLIRPSERGGFGLGLSGELFIPSGATGSFNSDRLVHGGPSVNALWRTPSQFELIANFGFDFRSQSQIRNYATGNSVRWGVGTVVPLPPVPDQFAAMANVFGTAGVEAPIDEPLAERFGGTENPVEALLGLRYDIDERFRLQAGGGTGLSTGPGAPDFRVFLSAHYRTPSRRSPAAESEPVGDPETEPADDSKASDESTDRDGDGIADADDDCPDEPETFNGVDDEDGCPDDDAAKVKIVNLQVQLAKPINFDTDKSDIRVEETQPLQDLVKLLDTYPQLTGIRVVGHADSRGTDEYNQKLSERRAAAVVRYLVDQGIDESRLRAVGKGEREPSGDNRTRDGRWKNRRVNFHIEELDGEPVTADSVQFEMLDD